MSTIPPSSATSHLTFQLHEAPIEGSPALSTLEDATASSVDETIADISRCTNKSNPALSFAIRGLQNAVFDYTSHASYMGGAEAEDDLEAEFHAMGPPTGNSGDNSGDNSSDNSGDDDKTSTNNSGEEGTVDPAADFAAVLTGASTGVTEGTAATYRSLMRQCTKFQRDHGFIKSDEEFFTSTPRKNAPELINSPQSDSCDSIKLDGTIRPKDELRATYSHAQKQRASVTYGFGRFCGLGNLPWHESEATPGKMLGNPSVSQQVSLYMVSLRRRKVQAREEPMSARAITPEIIRQMYNYNRQPQYFEIRPVTAKKRGAPNDPKNWGTPRLRRLMHFVYCISFVCLLRIDEALKITFDMVKFPEEHDGKLMELTLPFRKTNQYGDIKPFPIREFPEDMMYLCPVRAYLEWIRVSRITSGYVCRKINSADQVSSDDDDIMVSAKLDNIRKLPSLS